MRLTGRCAAAVTLEGGVGAGGEATDALVHERGAMAKLHQQSQCWKWQPEHSSDHGRRFSYTCRCTSSGLLHPCASSHSCISRARARTRPLAEARTTLDLALTTMTHSQKHVSGATRAQMAAAQVLRRAKSVVENVVALGNAVETTYASRFDAFMTTQRLLLRPTLMGRRRQPPPLPSTLWLLESRSV